MAIPNANLDETLPPGSRIIFTQPDERSCLFRLPGAGWRTSFLLFFSVQWIAYLIFALVVLEGVPLAWPLLVGLGVALVVGVVLLGSWAKCCFETVMVLLDQDQVVIKRDLLGWGRTTTTALNAESRADLVAGHSDNDSPIYHVEIRGAKRVVKFGDYLGSDELVWLADTINRFLGADLDPVGSAQAALRESILTESAPRCLTIAERTPDCLRLQLPTAATSEAQIGSMVLGITLAAVPVVAGLALHWWWPYYVVPASLCLLMASLLMRGRTTIELTATQLRQISHVGPWRYTRTVPVADIIRFDAVLNQDRERRVQLTNVAQLHHNCVAIHSEKRKRFFLWMAKRDAATYVAELLQQELNRRQDVNGTADHTWSMNETT